MLKFNVTLFKNNRDTRGFAKSTVWKFLAEYLTTHTLRPEKDGPAIGFYHLRDSTTRASENVESLSCVALDFDSGITYEQVSERLKEYAYACYSTHSNTADHPKFRVVLPLSEPVTPEQYAQLWRGAFELTGGDADPAAKDPARLFYAPSCPVENESFKFAKINAGSFLTPAGLIHEASKARPEPSRSAQHRTGDQQQFDEVRARLALAVLDWDDRDVWLKAGMALQSTGHPQGFGLWDEFAQRSNKYDETDQARTWAGFKPDGGVTMGTLYQMANMTIETQSLPYFAQSEVGLTDRFVFQHRRDVRYVTDKDDFIYWNGTHWQQDTNRIKMQSKMIETTRLIVSREVTPLSHTNPDRAKQVLRWAEDKAQKHQTMHSAIKLARSYESIVIRSSSLDANPFFLQVRNGIIDLTKGTLLPNDRAALTTRTTDVTFDPSAKAPRWEQFLETVTGGDRELSAYLQCAVGYSLSGDTSEQKFLFLFGNGSNGKTVFLTAIRALMGAYGIDASSATFMQQHNSGGATPNLVPLENCRAVFVSEIEANQRLDEALIKTITGGEPIPVRDLYKLPHSFTPKCKLWFAGNHKPSIRSAGHGIWRRVHLVPFSVTIPEHEKDEYLVPKLYGELPGILNWAVEGFQQWQKQRLNPPSAVREAVNEYKDEEDVLADWIAACCIADANAQVLRPQVSENYTQFMAFRSRAKRLSEKGLYAALRERGYKEVKTNGQYYFRGFGIKPSSAFGGSSP